MTICKLITTAIAIFIFISQSSKKMRDSTSSIYVSKTVTKISN